MKQNFRSQPGVKKICESLNGRNGLWVQLVIATLYSYRKEGVLAMKYRTRIYYTDEQKSLMWDRWQKGEAQTS